MLRISEVLLFLTPILLFGGWLLLGRRAQRLLWVTMAAVLALGLMTAWFGISQRLPRGVAYVPATTVDGRIVEGHAAR